MITRTFRIKLTSNNYKSQMAYVERKLYKKQDNRTFNDTNNIYKRINNYSNDVTNTYKINKTQCEENVL